MSSASIHSCDDCNREVKAGTRLPIDRRPWVVKVDNVHVCALHATRRRQPKEEGRTA